MAPKCFGSAGHHSWSLTLGLRLSPGLSCCSPWRHGEPYTLENHLAGGGPLRDPRPVFAGQVLATRAPARLRLPRRTTSQPPARRSSADGRHPSSAIFALFTYAPPSDTVRRAAPRLSARPVATSRSTTVGPSASRNSAVGTSASAASSVGPSSSRSSPRPNSAPLAATTCAVAPSPCTRVVI